MFSLGRAEFRRHDRDLDTHVEISVSPEDDVELRRVSLTNLGRTARTIELTSFAEVVLAPPAADAAHPAFSNLFVQTELLRASQAIIDNWERGDLAAAVRELDAVSREARRQQ